jgi:alpha-L-arabinofuranosidase
LADQRKADGSADPYAVRYRGISNEVWAAGGDMTVEDYAGLCRRFTSNVPTYGIDLGFIACGGPPPTTDNEWIRQAFNAGDWYDVLGKSAKMNDVIERRWEEMAEFDPTHKIEIAADEWGAFEKGGALSPLNLTGRPVTLRDALAAALTLDIFHKHADKLLLALFTGLINQEGGLFRAEGDKFVATPIYLVFQLYAPSGWASATHGVWCARNSGAKGRSGIAPDGERLGLDPKSWVDAVGRQLAREWAGRGRDCNPRRQRDLWDDPDTSAYEHSCAEHLRRSGPCASGNVPIACERLDV